MAVAQSVESVPVPDDILIQGVLQGDEESFEVLYERYFPRVSRFVNRRIRNRSDAEEVVQEVFISIFSSLGSFRAEAPFIAWVLGLTRRTIAARFKKKRHPTVPLDSEEELERSGPLIPTGHREATPLENYECRERYEHLQEAATDRLNADQWQLFELYHLKHQSIREIAATTHKTEDAVKSNLYRARKLLLAQ